MDKKAKRRAQELADRLNAQCASMVGVTMLSDLHVDVVPANLNRFYVTKEELEAHHNPVEKSPEVVQLTFVFDSKNDTLLDYYLTSDFENELSDQPPKSAEYLAYLFLPRTDRDTLLGDLTEEYPYIVAKFGSRGANVYFYKQVVCSIWPLVRKTVIKWGAFGWVVEVIRRISL
jgi:hypothetical protein